MANEVASISEIFSSIQGEGLHVGERHLFVRFESCNLNCAYCDEVMKTGQEFDLEQTLSEIQRLDKTHGPHSCVSLTGGEPLVYVSFLKQLAPRLKELGYLIYLETNGVLAGALGEIIQWVDVVAMDMKPSSVTGECSQLQAHRKFLDVACRSAVKPETFVKIVCSRRIDVDEFSELCNAIKHYDSSIPLVLQPISNESNRANDSDLIDVLEKLQMLALQKLNHVRIIPRLHRILNRR